jgi:outer membrane protein assembly factor BamB
MKTPRQWWTLPILLALVLPSTSLASGRDWSQYRGTFQDGSAHGAGVFDAPFGLAVAWKQPLGSAYSAISVLGDVGVTMTSDGKDDLLVAFDTATGDERWRYRLSDMYAGHDGSHDGPNSTPAIHDDTVYAVAPSGQVVAVRLADGSEVWTHVLGESDSRAPFHGFTTAPVVAGGAVVVLAGGGEGNAVVAFDRETGAKLWSYGSDEIQYETPLYTELAGHKQLVVATGTKVYGLNPQSGAALWVTQIGSRSSYVLPVVAGKNRILVNGRPNATMLEVSAQDDAYEVKELWSNNSFGHSFSLPVYHQGYLYGFAGTVLSCVNAETGERVWRSRSPGGNGVILVDGHLVVLSPEGEVVVALATPEGYHEKARLAALDGGHGYTAASFARGHVYVRNYEEMAGVRVTTTPLIAEKKPIEPLRGEFGAWVAKVQQSQNKSELVEALLAAQESLPILEEGGLVHFLYQGDAQDVAISGNLSWPDELPMQRLEDTDLFFKSIAGLDPAGHWQYSFNVDYGDAHKTDPRNPHVVLGVPGGRYLSDESELRMPGWKVPAFLSAEPEQRGQVENLEWTPEGHDSPLQASVYLPPGYTERQARYPLLLVLNDEALSAGRMDLALDHLIEAGRIEPLVAVFLPRQRGWSGEGHDTYLKSLVEEVVPHLESTYRLDGEATSRGMMGTGSAAAAAVLTAFKKPGFLSRVAVQSFYMGTPVSRAIPELAAATEPQDLRIFVELSRNDYDIQGIQARADSDALLAALREKGYEPGSHEIAGTPSWGSWRGQTAALLEYLYPAPGDD